MREDKRITEARVRALDYMDYITEIREGKGFVEIAGNMGGDDVTYRFYDDGRVTAR